MADMDQLAKILAAQPAQQRESKVYGSNGKEYGVDYVDPPPLGAVGARFGFRGAAPLAKINPAPWLAGTLGSYVGYKAGEPYFGAPSSEDLKILTEPKWRELLRDIVTGKIVQHSRDFDAANNARVPYPPDPNKP